VKSSGSHKSLVGHTDRFSSSKISHRGSDAEAAIKEGEQGNLEITDPEQQRRLSVQGSRRGSPPEYVAEQIARQRKAYLALVANSTRCGSSLRRLAPMWPSCV